VRRRERGSCEAEAEAVATGLERTIRAVYDLYFLPSARTDHRESVLGGYLKTTSPVPVKK
jgi:hypothetical protein